MKKIMMFLTIGATVALLALPVVAQTQPAAAPAATTQDSCPPEARDALYKTFTENRTKDQKAAYEAGKKYLDCKIAAPTESQTKIIEYLTRWVTAYEKGDKWNRFIDALYNKKNYPEAFKLGGEFKEEPESTKAMVHLGANGYLVGPLKNPQLTAEAVDYARRAMQALEGGKTIDDWTPLQGQQLAVAYMNYTVGSLTVEQDPSNALKFLIKSTQFETPLKKSAFTYALIAGAYETGPYAKQAEAYKIYKDKEETPESKLALANIHQIVDRMIDGYARAVALAGPDLATQKATWHESLKQWYKFRNPNDPETAVDTLIAGILSKPLPPEPTPLTSLPATPATTSGTPAAGTPSGTTNGTGNGATAPAKPTATPAATPASANTKPAQTTPKKPRR